MDIMKVREALDNETKDVHFTSARNACKLCSPLGASVAFKGIRGCVPLIHGSQGCSTYIRRYLISHFKEPVDIASTNFTQEATIFGGYINFIKGIDNIIQQYKPEVIAISSTCLSETIGENIPGLINAYRNDKKNSILPEFIFASTPSYQGTHIDGFHEAVAATVKCLAIKSSKKELVNIFPGFISPEDIRYLKEIFSDYSLENILFPDYSETLDGPNWEDYQPIPKGGTPIDKIKEMGSAIVSIEFGEVFNQGNISGRVKDISLSQTAGMYLNEEFGINLHRMGIPIGIKATDNFFKEIEDISKTTMPLKYQLERGRLIDSYIDGHKYVFGKKAIVYGEEDFVLAMRGFLEEIGIEVALCAGGGEAENFNKKQPKSNNIYKGADFETIKSLCSEIKPDLLIGNSKGYYIARELKIPLIRVGFPIHDRIGGQRILHIGYRGAQQLFDKITNALIEYKQENSPVGYKYI